VFEADDHARFGGVERGAAAERGLGFQRGC